MSLRKGIIIAAALILIGIIVYSFLWGRLFPYSPITVGFEEKEFNKAIICCRKGTDTSKLIIIDSLMNEVEDFHQLKFRKKVKIFVFNSDREYTRYTGHTARFVTFPIDGRIFVSGKANKESQEGKIHMDVYLKHELSHALLFQNMSLYHSCYFPGWLLEGIAVYSANQMGVDGYFTKEETFNKIREGYFFNPDDWGTLIRKTQSVKDFPLPNKYWFIYSEFACLVDNMIQDYGKEKFLEYMTELLGEKDDKKVFREIFGVKFEKYVEDFKNRIGHGSE